VLPLLPARAPFVRALRRLFKYAELTDDPEFSGRPARVFELASAMYRRAERLSRPNLPAGRERTAIGQGRDDERIAPSALSDVTLLYFKRRAWRAAPQARELHSRLSRAWRRDF